MLPRRGGLLERVSREEWNLGVVPQTIQDIAKNGITTPVRWLDPMHRWYGLADPACLTNPDGTQLLLAERPNYWSGRGDIWMAHVEAGQATRAKFEPWAKANTHLSYPFPFRSGGDLYLLMEAGDAGALYLWRLRNGAWASIKLLERPVIDPTIFCGHDRFWLFCTFADDEPNTNLHLYSATHLEGPWTPHPDNPVKSDLASSRPAGPLFFDEEHRLIRPSQDCTQSYGSALVLNVVTEITAKSYREQPIRRLLPLPDYPDGLHTICPAGDVTIIDGKRWGFHYLDPLRYLLVGGRKRLRRLSPQRFHVTFREFVWLR